MKKKIRVLISIVLTLITLTFAVLYLNKHRSLLSELSHISLLTILLLLILYFLIFIILLFILDATLKICSKDLSRNENVLLNAYSLFINFFIPGQGGPAFRGIYLNRKHRLSIKKYIYATLIYYFFYGLIGIFLILLGSQSWWLTLIGVVLLSAIGSGAIIIARHTSKFNLSSLNLKLTACLYLLVVTLLQSAIQIIIYFVELHHGHGTISLPQVITYTGVANLALFVSLTPGAIGIRESFLIFSQHLHHISSANIIVANVIDRSVYLIFLLCIFILMVSLHAKEKLLKVTTTPTDQA